MPLITLIMNSMLMNQQCIVNKVSLNRNTHKTKSHIDQLLRMFDQRLTVILLLEVIGSSSVFMVTL